MYINQNFKNAITLMSPRVAFRIKTGDEIITSVGDGLLIEANWGLVSDSFIGEFSSSQLKVTFLYIDKVDYVGKSFEVEVGAYTFENDNYTNINWMPIGIYHVEEEGQETDEILHQIILTMYNTPSKINDRYEPLEFPLTGLQVRTQLAEQLGLEFSTTQKDLLYDDYLFQKLNVSVNQAISYREVLKQYAQLNMASCYVDRYGKLVMKSVFNETTLNEVISNDDYDSLKNEVLSGPINSVIYSNKDTGVGQDYQEIESKDDTSVSQNGKTSIKFSNNVFLDPLTLQEQQIQIDKLLTIVNGFSFAPFDINYFARPDFDPYDIVKLKDMNGNEAIAPLTNMEFIYNGGLTGTLKTKELPEILSKSDIPNIFERVSNAEIRVDRVENKITLEVENIETKIENIELTPGPKGDKGDTGSQGIPGQKGQDGKTTYTWIKYADTPTSGMSDLPDNKKYMGIAVNKDTPTESTNYSDYSWAKFEGDKGSDGIPGTPGADGITYYTWIKYADTPTTGMSNSPSGKAYIGIAHNQTTATESSVYSDYAWSLIKGDKGDKGEQGIPGQKGADGQTTYTWLKYADTPTSGMSDLPAGKKYMGIAVNKTTATESTNYADYTWSKVEGDQGIPGTPGADGKPTYTWIKYADTPTSGMDDNPDGKKYIGLAFNKTTQTESTSYSQYQWSLMPQNITVGGRNLLRNSGVEVSNGSYNIARYDFTDEIKVGEEVTLTIWGELASTKSNFRAYNSGGSVSVATLTDNGDGTYSSTFKWVIGSSTNTYLNVYAFTNTQTGISTISKIKLEKGNTPTDWSPAPEDVSDKLDNLEGDVGAIIETTTEMAARININSESIENEVERSTIQGDELVEQTKSLAEQLADSFTLIFEQMEKNETTEEGLDLLRTYFRFDINGAIVGKTGSPITLHTTNDGIEIRDNGIVIAYWKEGTMSVDYLITKISIVIGTHSIDKYFSPIFNDTTTTVRYTDET